MFSTASSVKLKVIRPLLYAYNKNIAHHKCQINTISLGQQNQRTHPGELSS